MAAHNEMGRWGEDQAVAYLEQQGYTILERDWHSGHRDIDIIALHGRHAELRNVVEKSELKKRQRSKNKKTGARRESRSPFSSIYFVLSSNLRT